jgi:opacity protein-like surface antigen
MKTYLARAVAVAVLLCAGATAQAQYSSGKRPYSGFNPGETLVAANYEISAPLSDLKSFISDWSFRGFSVEGRYMLANRLSVGGSLAINRFQTTNTNAQVAINNGVITGPVFRYFDTFAIRAIAHYYLMDGPIQPYVGAGIGGTWAYSYQQVVDIGRSTDNFNFIVDPEVGVLWEITHGPTSLHLNLAIRYTYTTASLVKGSNAQWATLPVIGLAWSY